MKRSMIFKSLSIVMVAGAVWSCSSKQVAKRSGNEVYDDLYAQVGETSPRNVSYKDDLNNKALNQNPEQGDDRAYDQNGTTDYYSEGGIDSRDYQRSNTDRPGFNDYRNGYQDGVADSRWNWGNNWNSGFGSFNRYGWNSFNNWYNPSISIIIGGNRWRNNYFGYNSFWNDPFYAYNGWGNSWNSFGYGGYYDPFYSNYYSPFGYNSFYGGGYGGGWISSPRYYSGNYANNSNILGADRANRNYGPRNGARNSGAYNDQFVNTAKPRTTSDPNMRKGTVYNDPANNTGSYGSGAGYSAKTRGGYTGNSNTATNSDTRVNSSNGSSSNSSRGTDTYSSRPRGGYAPVIGSTNADQTSSNNSSNARPSANTNSDNTYYARPSRSFSTNGATSNGGYNSGNSSGSYSRGSSNSSPSQSSQSSNWSGGSSSGGRSSSSSYSSPSYSSGSSSSGSSSSGGGSSRGSSGGSSSGGGGGGGGSRGPR